MTTAPAKRSNTGILMLTGSRWASGTTAIVALTVGAVLTVAQSRDEVFVVGPYGGTSIVTFLWFIGGMCFAYATCAGAWQLTQASRPGVRSLVRVAAALVSAVLLLGVVLYGWLSSLGGSERYIDVGTAHGRTITVAEYTSLGGTTLNLGERTGWHFRPGVGVSAWANADQPPPGPPRFSGGRYGIHTDGNEVRVSYGGSRPLQITLR